MGDNGKKQRDMEDDVQKQRDMEDDGQKQKDVGYNGQEEVQEELISYAVGLLQLQCYWLETIPQNIGIWEMMAINRGIRGIYREKFKNMIVIHSFLPSITPIFIYFNLYLGSF